MKNWEGLYSILKMTREEKNNVQLTDENYVKRINKIINIKDIEKMPADEIKEGVINYLLAVVPGFNKWEASKLMEQMLMEQEDL